MIRAFFIFALLISFEVGFSQSFVGSVRFGTNLSQVDGDEVFGYKKFGLNAGISTLYPIITDKLFGSVEISFSQKGAFQKYPIVEDPTKNLPYYNLRLNYLDIPFMLHWYDKKTIMVGSGISYGRLIGLKEIEWGKTVNSQVSGGPYKHTDWSWLIDVRFPLKENFKIDFRYNYSISKIRTRSFEDDNGTKWTRKQFNNYLTLSIVYILNENKARK